MKQSGSGSVRISCQDNTMFRTVVSLTAILVGVGAVETGDPIRGVASESCAQAATAGGLKIVVGLRGLENILSSGDLLQFIGALNRWVIRCITPERGEDTFSRVRKIRLWRGHIQIVADNEETKEWITGSW